MYFIMMSVFAARGLSGLVVPRVEGKSRPAARGRHGQAEAGAERSGRGGARRSGGGYRRDFVGLGHPSERLRRVLCVGMRVLRVG